MGPYVKDDAWIYNETCFVKYILFLGAFQPKKTSEIHLFTFSETECKIKRDADKRNAGYNSPDGFFTDGAEVFLQTVNNGPDRQEKEGHRDKQDNADGG